MKSSKKWFIVFISLVLVLTAVVIVSKKIELEKEKEIRQQQIAEEKWRILLEKQAEEEKQAMESRKHIDEVMLKAYSNGIAVSEGMTVPEDRGSYSKIEGVGRHFSAGENIQGHIIIFENNYAYINSSIEKCPWSGTVYGEGSSKSVYGFYKVDPLKEDPSAYYVKANHQLYFPLGGV